MFLNPIPLLILVIIIVYSVQCAMSQQLTSFEYEGVQYFYDNVKRNFTDSRQFCEMNHGELIQTGHRSVIKNLHGHVYWLGVPSSHHRTYTHYFNGQPIRSNWMAGQPNGQGCQAIQVDMRNSLGFWLDFDCSDKVTTVCEKKLARVENHLAMAPSVVSSSQASPLPDQKLRQFITSVDKLNSLLTNRTKDSAVSKFMLDSMYCVAGSEPRCRTACDLCTEEEAATWTTSNTKLYSCCTQQCICETH